MIQAQLGGKKPRKCRKHNKKHKTEKKRAKRWWVVGFAPKQAQHNTVILCKSRFIYERFYFNSCINFCDFVN